MKSAIGICLLCLFIAANAIAQKKDTPKNSVLIWSEEFNYKGFPDAKKWGYETGFIRNSEKQFYTKGRAENAYVNGSELVITSLKEKYETADYTSASINTLGKKGFDGDIRIEIKAKLPFGKGIWPALWLMGTNISEVGWPKCVEFDIMEFVGHTPGTIHANLHWWDTTSAQSNKHASRGNQIKLDDIHTNYHVYGLERRGDSISVFVDDKYYFSMRSPQTAYSNSFKGPLYLLINTAVGGEWGGPIDDSIFPQKYFVDYVRVYKLD